MNPEAFNAAVVANLREVKDPFLAAAAARLTCCRGTQGYTFVMRAFPWIAGAMSVQGEESADNPRYEWLGGLNPAESRKLISRSDMFY